LACKSAYNRDTCTPVFTAALFTIAKLWKQPRHIYTTEYFTAIKNNYKQEVIMFRNKLGLKRQIPHFLYYAVSKLKK
jgi:hypothetical protein